MNELIKKVLEAKIAYSKNFSGESDIIFVSPELLHGLMELQETYPSYHDQKLTIYGCEPAIVSHEGFEVLASSHDQMKLISERHVGTTDDIKLEKPLMMSRLEYMSPPEFYTPEYITIPFYILESYRKLFQPKPEIGQRIREPKIGRRFGM